MKIKTKFAKKLLLVNFFIQLFISKKNVTPTFHKKILTMVNSMEDFYKQLELLNFDVINFENKPCKDYSRNQESFLQLMHLINDERKLLLKHFGVVEVDHRIKGKLKIPTSMFGQTWQILEQKMMTGKLSPGNYENTYRAIWG